MPLIRHKSLLVPFKQKLVKGGKTTPYASLNIYFPMKII
jgi:hypothetical protein